MADKWIGRKKRNRHTTQLSNWIKAESGSLKLKRSHRFIPLDERSERHDSISPMLSRFGSTNQLKRWRIESYIAR